MAMTVWRTGAWSLQIVKRSDAAGFEVLPKRWIVERTFAWISRNRRLSRDFNATQRPLLHSSASPIRIISALLTSHNPNFPCS